MMRTAALQGGERRRPIALLVRLLLVLAVLVYGTADAQSPSVPSRELPPGLQVPAAAQPGPDFDVERATEAWLALLTPEQRALSDAYFEGNYWLLLWHLVYTLGVMALLLYAGLSRWMRDFAERRTRRPTWRTLIYAGLFVVVVFVLELPAAVYVGFVREHAYGLSNLTFGAWLREALLGLAVNLVLGSLVIGVGYAGLRRAGERWWVWATGLSLAFTLFLTFAYPLAIAPLFNKYKPLPEGEVREAILKLARANEVPTQHLEWFDASKQTTRISANVSGIGPVARINLNDNLLERTSLPEIKAVLGHEMGHYVLGHSLQLSVYLAVLYGITFLAVERGMRRVLATHAARFGIRGRADPAGFPLLVALFSAVWFLLTPFAHTVVRLTEAEADAFGLNAAREPEGFAMVSVRLSTYRKLKPSPVEEFLFYDHPSGYDRVRRSMLWRKENLGPP